MIHRLRYRLARRLVGHFVQLPERDGVWVVTQGDNGRVYSTIEAETYTLTSSVDLALHEFGNIDPDSRWAPLPRRPTIHFEGTA